MAGLWSVALRAAVRAFGSLGVDVVELCRRCDIDPRVFDDPDARVPLELTGRIWPEGARMWGRPGLGLHAGRAVSFGSLEALDYSFATAATVGDGLARMARWFDVVTNGVTRLHIVEDERAGEVRIESQPLPIDDLRDYGAAVSVERLRFARVTPLRIELRGGPLVPLDEYEAVLGCATSFERPGSVVVLSAADARRELPASFPGLNDVIERELSRVRVEASRAHDPLLDVRREVLAALGPDAPSLKVVARRLAVGERTLQRRLAEQHTTFKHVVDEARRGLALEHLRGDRLSVGEVAMLLGYSEPSAFSRAFRRWTGEWPVDYRRARRHGSSKAPPGRH